jgi:hypothetical protein
LKRFDFIATRCDDVKVVFRAKDADQAPISNDYTSHLISTHYRKLATDSFYGSPHSAFRIAFNTQFALAIANRDDWHLLETARLPLCWLEVVCSMTSGT